ncbi:MAG: DNA/RNA non-specific endonuclease [Bacteroidales bacterium]|nr:DNA/RNA non-specific endonuclease [Bacteroidales bacterium]
MDLQINSLHKKNRLNAMVFCLFFVFVLSSCSAKAQRADIDLAEIACVQQNQPCQLIEHIGYTVCYNSQWHIPNWVAYELTDTETKGVVPRKGNDFFTNDPSVTGDFITHSDYSGSGYDRGHMAPAGDMKWSTQAMAESFYMSNMCPQDHNLNDGDWKILEERIRKWASQCGSIYIVCGPIVSEYPQTVGRKKIVVPEGFFKVLLKQTTKGTETIGFVFQNNGGHKPLSSYVMTVDEIEAITNIDFFQILPDEVEDVVEGTYNLSVWGL